MRPSTTIAFDYPAFVADLKTRIASARLTAARAVNSELVGLYWDIGAAIDLLSSVSGRSPADPLLTVSAPLRSISHPAGSGASDRCSRYCSHCHCQRQGGAGLEWGPANDC